ncbi:MAG: MFS transporter [Patescibacteria group bacterium]
MSRNIWKYYLFSFFTSLAFFGGVLIPFFTVWGHINQFQIQLLQAWFMFWIFVLEIPTGAIADYFGRKYSIVLGAIVSTFAALLYGSFPNFGIFLLGEFLFAAAIALQSGADEALIYDSLKQAGQTDLAKKVLGRARSFELLAIGIAAPIGSFIAAKLDMNFPMLFSAIPFVIAALIAMTFKEIKTTHVSESKRYLVIIRDGLKYLKNHPTLKILALDAIVVASSAYFVLWLYQRLLQQIGVAIIWFGFFHLLLTSTEILISSNFHLMEKIVGSIKNYLKFSALLVGIGFIAAGIWPNLFTLGLLIILSGGFGLTRLTHISAHLNKLIPSQQRATILSSISMFRRFFLVLLNPIVGLFVDKSLSLTMVGLGLIPVIVFLFSPIKDSTLSESKTME